MTDSPTDSSLSVDFASFLDEYLSSEDGDGEESLRNERVKRQKLELLGSPEKSLGSTSGARTCLHEHGSFEGMCYLCGQDVGKEDGVSLSYMYKGLRATHEEITRIRKQDNVLDQKKLYLILDLDHTLLNSTPLRDMTPEEDYLKTEVGSSRDVINGSLFKLEEEKLQTMTKLRPYARQFLKEASQMFEMYICTMGNRLYARKMAELLDPTNEYFDDGRVISRDDGSWEDQKSLDGVLGQERAVLILDDREDNVALWIYSGGGNRCLCNVKSNCLPLLPQTLGLYNMEDTPKNSTRKMKFSGCWIMQGRSFSECKTDESETDGALKNILGVLSRTHSSFFDDHGDDLSNRDVREVLKAVRKEILRGCKIVFSGISTTSSTAGNHPLWEMAEKLGATCSVKLDSSVTHVVANNPNTEKSQWAIKEKKFLVHHRWIKAAYYLWRRLPEEIYQCIAQNGIEHRHSC